MRQGAIESQTALSVANEDNERTTDSKREQSVIPSRASDGGDERLVPCSASDSEIGTTMSSSASDGGKERLVPYSASESGAGSIMSTSASDGGDEGLVPYTASDSSSSEDDMIIASTASDSETVGGSSCTESNHRGEGLVPYPESDSEDDTIMSSRPAIGRGPAGRQRANAARRVSHHPVTSETAQTKAGGHSVGKQRGSESVPPVSKFGLGLYGVGNTDELEVVTAPSPASRSSSCGLSHAKSAIQPRGSRTSRTPPSAEKKSQRPVHVQKSRAEDGAKYSSDELSPRDGGRSPKALEATPHSLAAGSKTVSTRARRVHADKEICDAAKKVGFDTGGSADEQSLRSRTRRASRATTRAIAAPSFNPVGASRTKAWRRVAEAEATLPGERPSASTSQISSRESPAVPKTMAHAETGRPAPIDAKLTTLKERTIIPKRIAAGGSATAVTETTKAHETPVTHLSRSESKGDGSTAGSGTGGIPERTVSGGVPESDQADSAEDERSDISSDEEESDEEARIRADDYEGENSGGGRQDGGSDVDEAWGDHAAVAGTRQTHKKRVWHAGRSSPWNFFGLKFQKNASVEVLWEVERKPSGTTVRYMGAVVVPYSVDNRISV